MRLVSVILPIYGVEKYLKTCVESVRQQTYKNIEIILVDDGSPDGCGDMCDQFAKEDKRIKVIHKKNAGLGFARNSGLKLASGDYIMFIDSDDWIDKHMVSILVEKAENYSADMVTCGFKKCTDDTQMVGISKVINVNISSTTVYEGHEQIIAKGLCPILGADAVKKNPDSREMSACINLYKKSIIEQSNLEFVSERLYLSEDLFFNISYILRCNRIVLVPDCLYYYRYNPVSLSNGYRPNRVKILEEMTSRTFETLEKEGIISQTGYRVERLYFKKLRNCLMQIAASSIPQKEKSIKYKEAVCSELCQKLSHVYPYKKVPMKECVFVKLVREKHCKLLRIYMDLQRIVMMLKNTKANR